jgi:hypothetical protein
MLTEATFWPVVPLGRLTIFTMSMWCTIPRMETNVDIPPESWINDRKADWLTELSPDDYRRCLSLLEEVLGIPYRYSPESTAAALLRSLHNRPGGKRLQVAAMPPPALEPTTERDLHWIRPLLASERSAPYIVAYDTNAAYLAACSALRLGVGAPLHRVANEAVWEARYEKVGYFLCDGVWMTTPALWWQGEHPARRPMAVTHSWTWDETSRPLEPWYKVLRDARARLMAMAYQPLLMTSPYVVQAALQTIKMMYCGFFGWVASTKWDRTGDPLFRPDCRHMVIATRRTRLLRVMAQCDPAPFAAYSDCLYFATQASPQVQGLRLGTNPGSFKIHGTVRHEGEVRAATEAGDLNALLELVK